MPARASMGSRCTSLRVGIFRLNSDNIFPSHGPSSFHLNQTSSMPVQYLHLCSLPFFFISLSVVILSPYSLISISFSLSSLYLLHNSCHLQWSNCEIPNRPLYIRHIILRCMLCWQFCLYKILVKTKSKGREKSTRSAL